MSEERKITNEIVLPADADTVWRAVSEGEELAKWFPLDARVKPGAGGSVWLSWGEGADWEAPIRIWEPGKHLRTVDPAPSKMAVDYIIESRGGETVLRIVSSGFSGEDAWQDELDMSSGWNAFLVGLRHYLEHHRGQPRAVAYMRHPVVEITREEGFARMLRVFGFNEVPRVGEQFDVTTKFGERLQGTIEIVAPPINLTATLTSLNRAFLMIEIERGRGRCRPAAWLSLFGEAAAEAAGLQERLRVEVLREIGLS
jgi:uncharacterized protein YndB with AHSA1/START domain